LVYVEFAKSHVFSLLRELFYHWAQETASCSITGLRKRQGAHQVAQQSTTARGFSSVNDSKVESVMSCTMIVVPFLSGG
jgi:hypothetical protein